MMARKRDAQDPAVVLARARLGAYERATHAMLEGKFGSAIPPALRLQDDELRGLFTNYQIKHLVEDPLSHPPMSCPASTKDK